MRIGQRHHMDHFRYINTIRRPDGTLRDWKEHNLLAMHEHILDNPYNFMSNRQTEVDKIKDDEIYWIKKSK